MFKKLKSKKGYIFTYEALFVSFIFILIFSVMTMAYNHNIQTFLENKKDIDKLQKAPLLKDYYLEKYSFPGIYNNGAFKNNIVNNLQEKINFKTFDIHNNISENNKMFFNISISKYYQDLNNTVPNITYYTNVAQYNNTYQSGNVSEYQVFKEIAYIPIITTDSTIGNGLNNRLYGCNGDIIYFYSNNVNNFRMRILNQNNENVKLLINNRLFSKNINTTFQNFEDISNVLVENQINEIKILYSSYPVEFKVGDDTTNIQVVTFSPQNITILVAQ